jgi:hypothetical protein
LLATVPLSPAVAASFSGPWHNYFKTTDIPLIEVERKFPISVAASRTRQSHLRERSDNGRCLLKRVAGPLVRMTGPMQAAPPASAVPRSKGTASIKEKLRATSWQMPE